MIFRTAKHLTKDKMKLTTQEQEIKNLMIEIINQAPLNELCRAFKISIFEYDQHFEYFAILDTDAMPYEKKLPKPTRKHPNNAI